MSNATSFPNELPVEVIDEAHFEKYADAALLLKCFEVVQDTLEVICEPEYTIEKEDDTHIDLIRAFYALKVMFKRRTGHDAKQVALEHWEAQGRHLLEGGPAPDRFIPMVKFPGEPLPEEAFEHLNEQQLACAAFNYNERIRRAIMDNSPHEVVLDEARVFSIDAHTALRQLVLRLSGGSVEAMAAQIARKPGETLQ
ncbi:hypothetical protein ACDH60_10320 [Pseudomonas ficuserectae]|uniref:Uncharacterized protein n=2 Tax=Pseudomonas amygdali pv. lachrymans TaxID=53707 RepID=A0AB37R6Z5_PSEAV|nr:hypothetical protein [Pseudomonas amygdali]ARA79607.1 hypothetical protein B5U27_05740 [Pseudomonas amygdali pv. lachrymans]AXH54873.1 hypothetical protein PLA107_005645 [Pseudomonas amygdali pv. lachrymans str. M301315]KKY57471.1 hypothetical protein AAY85_13225 [Pseudomonas amygdali pv. lachrymans]KPC01810.1 Uncharacterized protein AC501_3093 [Pseudomonas amygdali pv. lachrymans]KPC19955.1 Uncharacterized protein AC499_2423 [Pseudomonas amygdali pv. lachrymans]